LIDTKFLLREEKFNKVTPCNTLQIHLIIKAKKTLNVSQYKDYMLYYATFTFFIILLKTSEQKN